MGHCGSLLGAFVCYGECAPHSLSYQSAVGNDKANNLVVIGSILIAKSTALNHLEDMLTSIGQKGLRSKLLWEMQLSHFPKILLARGSFDLDHEN